MIDSTSCKKTEASKFGGLERLPNKIFLLFVGTSSNQITSILGRSASGLEIATDTVANATNIFSLATKNSGLVAKVATRF